MPKIFTSIFCLNLIFFISASAQSQTWEVYDSKFQLQSRLMYDTIELLSETVKIGKSGDELFLLTRDFKPALTLEGKEVYQYLEPWILVRSETGIGAYHEYGQQVLKLEYDEIETYFNLLLARKGNEFWIFQRGDNSTTYLGELEGAKISDNGMLITQKNGSYFLPLSKTPERPYELLLENAGNFLLAKENTGYGLINRAGDYVMDPILEQLEHTEGDFFYGYDENQYLLIKGHEINATVAYNSFHKITYENGLMLEYIHGKLRRVMEEDGILLDAVGMEEVTLTGKNLYTIRFRDGKIGLLGKKGWLVQPMSNVESLNQGKEGLFPAKSSKGFGFVNAAGEWIISPQFPETGLFTGSIATYRNNQNWGLISKTGELLGNAEWDEIKPFENQLTVAKQNSAYYLLDTRGNRINQDGFDHISRIRDGYFLVEKAGKSGLLKANGEELLPIEFEGIRREKNDFIIVQKSGKTGVLNEMGEVIVPLAYEDVQVDWSTGQILTRNLYEPVIVQAPEKTRRRNRKGA